MKLTHEELTSLVTTLGELDIKMAELLGMAKGKEQIETVKAAWNMVADARWLILDNLIESGRS